MVFTSAPLRPIALRQLAHLTVGPRGSAPGSELGHLAVQAPDDHGQISATWTCLLTTRSDTDRPHPPTGPGLVALLRQGTRCIARGSSTISSASGRPTPVSVWSRRNAVGSSSLAIRGEGHRVPSATGR